jgi:transposase
MAFKSRSKRSRGSRSQSVHKPHGVVHPRVQAVGPEHFGFVCIDCAKARSKTMLADFYGRILLQPMVTEHDRAGLEATLQAVRDCCARHGIKDLIVVIERTGRYHGPIQRAFLQAGFEVRILHPFTTKQFRQPADPGNKTDDTDLLAIHRGAVNGFGLLEHEPDPIFDRLQLLARHRRSLVQKNVVLRQQMLEHLHSYMPGYSKCFADIFDSEIMLWVAKNQGSAVEILRAGIEGLVRQLRKENIATYKPTLQKIVAWARSAPSAAEPALLHRRFFIDLDADRLARLQSIRAIEKELAETLSQTPYILLLSIPGISIVSAAEFAGEMGPIRHYAKARSVAGRAGLYPSRYQSDEVDRPDGPLVRRANHSLRRAILMIADNLINWNEHFGMLAAGWRLKKLDPRDIRVRVASRFCRIAFHMVAGPMSYRHPCSQQRDYILTKLIRFALDHEVAPDQLLRNLDAATVQLPLSDRREEAASLAEERARLQTKRGSGPRAISEILPAVLAKLEVNLIESTPSGEADLTERPS